jgi:hypothetical protein
MRTELLGFVGLLATMLIAAPVDAKTCAGTASGWGWASAEVDADGSGVSGSVGTAQGRDCFGQFTAGSAGNLIDWDGSTFCDFDDVGNPSGVVLEYRNLSQVQRYANGDLLFSELSESIPSTLCFNFVDGVSYTSEIHSDFVGGTGRFEGASGYAVGRGAGRNLRKMGASSAEFESEITLQRGND